MTELKQNAAQPLQVNIEAEAKLKADKKRLLK